MTENEAKKYGEDYLRDLSVAVCHVADKHKNFVSMAIQALEEVQAYRAIGTVEDLKSMKENGAFTGVELASIACMQMKLKDYQSIGTIDEFKALKEKSGASKKVVAISLTHEGRVGNCPNCNNFVAENYDKNCPKCRRELDWQ